MDINHIRVLRLKELIKAHGSQREMASAMDLDASYISQLVNGNRSIGEKTARKIEALAKKPEMWMDTPPESAIAEKSIYYSKEESIKAKLQNLVIECQESGIGELAVDSLANLLKASQAKK